MHKLLQKIIMKSILQKKSSLQKIIILCTMLIIVASNTTIMNAKPSAFQGRHFLIAFMQNEIENAMLAESTYFSIFISTTQYDTITVTIPNTQPATEKIILNAQQIYEIKVPASMEIKEIGVNQEKLIEIKGKYQMTCWAFSSKNQSSDSYVAFPVNTWGNEYRIISMPNDMYNGKERLRVDGATDANGNIINPTKYAERMTPRSGEFVVIANHDNTIVTYTPTANTRNGVSARQTGTVTLNKGEVLLVQAAGGAVGTEDLTGTLVKSNNPVGVISGHVRTSNRQELDNPYDTKDHLAEMLMPTKAWGKKFISVPFVDGQNIFNNNYFILGTAGDLIRVVAKEDNTRLDYFIHRDDETLDNRSTTLQRAGDVFEIEAAVPIIWEANKPVMVSQLMMRKGIASDERSESFDYDPSLVILAPVEQFIEDVTFSTPNNNSIFKQYKAHCVILVTDSIGIYNLFYAGMRMNGQNTNLWHQRIGDSKYFWAMKVLNHGVHRITSQNANFSGIIYGHGLRDSYAMTLGSRLNDPYNVDTIPPILSFTDSCGVLRIQITDVRANDQNATGIDWGFIKNNVNYIVEDFEISDTATVVNIFAQPRDYMQNASLEIEFNDKNYNFITQRFTYNGFRIEYPHIHDFAMLSWNNPTQAILKIRNEGTGTQKLQSIIQANDARLIANTNPALPLTINPNQTIDLILNFEPNEKLDVLDTKIILEFECNSIDIDVLGTISAPGLLADNLNFGKVRLFDTREKTGKIYNAGNIALVVDSLKKDVNESAFDWTFSEKFPSVELPISDSINYTVKFTPTEIREYKVVSQVVNNEGLNCTFFVVGESGAPNIEDIILDWGKRRIGTISDTVMFITNSGDFDDTVSYKSNVSISHSNDLSVDTLQAIKNLTVPEKQRIPINFSFIPQDTFSLKNIVELASRWEKHTPIYATVTAQGTIPVIETNDFDFGTHPINSEISVQHSIINSLGNEALTIDSIVFISGDLSSFIINYAQLQNFLVEPNTTFFCLIKFNPQFAGEHKIRLEITHDANPAYARSKDTVEIRGYSTSENMDLFVDLTMSELYSCQTPLATVAIKNIGQASIMLDSISLYCEPNIYEPNIFSATFVDDLSQIFPNELHGNEQINLPLKIYAEKNQGGILRITTHYNAENEVKIQKPISPITSTIKTNLIIPTNSIHPGETVSLFCKAEITQRSENEFNFLIKLDFCSQNFAVLEKKCYIAFRSNAKERILEVLLTQFENYLEFEIPVSDIKIDETTTVEFEIKLLALLSNQKETQFSFEVISEKCYNSEVAILDVDIKPVCADALRQLVFDGFPYLLIKQNPTENNIDFVINLMDDDIVSILLTDLLGTVIYEKNDLILEKGKHNFSIAVFGIVSAEYFLTTRSQQFSTTKKIILTK